MNQTPMRKGLTEAQRVALHRAADDAGGVAGSDQYPASWLGGIVVARKLNQRGLIELAGDAAGSGYRITPAGRSLLAQETDP